MIGYLVLGTLAAFGLVSALWALYGFLLPPYRDGVLFAPGRPGAAEGSFARRYFWLRELGLIRGKLVLVDFGLSDEERDWLLERGVEVCTPEQLPARMETGERTN